MKKLISLSALTQAILIVSMSSCFRQQECGFKGYANDYNEYFLCDRLLMQDTIDLGSDYTMNVDSIKFVLPKHLRIIDARQSFIITPSIWSKENDNVVQYINMDDLSACCVRQESILTNNNIIINPLRLDQKLVDELYFQEKSEISKNELLKSIQKGFEWQEPSPDEFTTTSDIDRWRDENDYEKKTYTNYLRNYTTWKNAPNWKDDLRVENPNFELLATTRYLTLSIQNEQNVKELTFIYSPIIGN